MEAISCNRACKSNWMDLVDICCIIKKRIEFMVPIKFLGIWCRRLKTHHVSFLERMTPQLACNFPNPYIYDRGCSFRQIAYDWVVCPVDRTLLLTAKCNTMAKTIFWSTQTNRLYLYKAPWYFTFTSEYYYLWHNLLTYSNFLKN